MKFLLPFLLIGLPLAGWAQSPSPTISSATASPSESHIPVTFTGGYDTVGQDRGRPVILIASALNVPPQVFRDAFSHVKPAGPGQSPEPEQVRKNKQALMTALGPLGVTDDRLNEVSNYYRYRRDAGELWKHVPATAVATVSNGAVTGITITNPGAGYSSAPTVTIPGMDKVHPTVTLAFTTDLKTNGSIKTISLTPPSGP